MSIFDNFSSRTAFRHQRSDQLVPISAQNRLRLISIWSWKSDTLRLHLRDRAVYCARYKLAFWVLRSKKRCAKPQISAASSIESFFGMFIRRNTVELWWKRKNLGSCG